MLQRTELLSREEPVYETADDLCGFLVPPLAFKASDEHRIALIGIKNRTCEGFVPEYLSELGSPRASGSQLFEFAENTRCRLKVT